MSPAAPSKAFSGVRHAHGCRRCLVRYEDACKSPAEDGLCIACRGGRPWMELRESAAPADCCLDRSRLVTKDEKKTYHLAGSRLWFICPTCKRTQPYDPRTSP